MTKELTIDEDGRITLPEEVRERLAKKPGLKMRLKQTPEGKFIIEIGYDPLDLKGIIKDRGIKLTVEEINQAILDKGKHI
ncbi:MAG: hypothetical protein FJY65_05245 [Calditrichaeota bacterium]|nr:hypothetical protein [Calditrichota bacterium]